jgi:CPA1 family monovalent cation:H+ antiporter
LLRALPAVLILAIPLLVFSAAVTGAILYWTINHPLGFPWLAALLTGALLSATDPGAVMSLLHRLGVPHDLILLLEGESLFNDATAIVLFSLLLGMATMEPQSPGPLEASLEFGRLFLGGLAIGLAVGLIAALLLQGFRRPPYPSIITLMAAYVSYLLAEFALGVSGVMSSLACGLVAGARHRALGSAGQEAVESIWQVLAWIANSAMFLLAGATVTLAMFQHRWLAMLLAIAAVLVTRWLSVLAASWMIRPIPGAGQLDRQARELMIWGGLRGAVTLALALSLPVELEYWWTIQSIAYGVVLFTLFVQAPTLPLVVRRLPS